jgi:hypothetical protein
MPVDKFVPDKEGRKAVKAAVRALSSGQVS